MSDRPTGHKAILPQMILCLVLGTIGGAIFWWLNVPLAWMLGALTATTIASLCGIQTGIPARFRSPMFLVIGVMIGSSFDQNTLGAVGAWAASFIGLFASLIASVFLGIFYLRRVAGFDPITAYFSSMPGGLSEMVLVGGQNGGDEDDIILTHSARVMLVVFAVPLSLQMVLGDLGAGTAPSSAPAAAITLMDIFWLLVAACGGLIARYFRVPAGMLLGALVASAIIHLLGLTHVSPPEPIVAAALVVIGGSLGSRFAGRSLKTILRVVAIAVGLTVILLFTDILFALAVSAVTDIPLSVLFIAYAPGGVGEMSLIALALDADPAFVSVHHLLRIIVIVLAGPFFFAAWRRFSGLAS